jgi:predicted  nucleic acid-binding Zn-ribbon protein
MHQASRPPQSVASVNITNLEDSEGLIRAYKKKKAELEELRERFYTLETDYFTVQERNKILEEDSSKMRAQIQKIERQLKDV